MNIVSAIREYKIVEITSKAAAKCVIHDLKVF